MKRRLLKLARLGLMLTLVAVAAFGLLRFIVQNRTASLNTAFPVDSEAALGVKTTGEPPHSGTGDDTVFPMLMPTTGTSAPSTGFYSESAPGDSASAYAPEGDSTLKSPDSGSTRGGTIYQPQYQSPLTAGQVDDNAKYQEYLDYLRSYYGYMPAIDISQRLFIRVLDNAQSPIAGAHVQLFDGIRQVFDGQTMSDGRALFLPKAAGVDQAQELKAIISRGQTRAETVVKLGGPEQLVTLGGVSDNTGAVGVDLVFLMDATGSMADEIAQVKETIGSIAQRIEQLPGSTAPRFGLVAFRDRGDDYVTRQWDFTSDISQFSANLSNVDAGGGGDTPESVSAGLHDAIHLQGWNDNSTGRRLRMIVLVGDAPPHVDYQDDYSYPALLGEATAQGIKIFSVGASNLDTDGEYVFRQFAQVTQGQFVFLTYANGVSGAPGTLTDKHVDDFTVQNLDSLIVGLVAGEVANQTGQKVDTSGSQPLPVVDSVVTPVTLARNWFDSLGDLFDNDTTIYAGAIMSVVLLVIYGTRREKARIDVRTQEQQAEIYTPESQTLTEVNSGPITAPLTYFRREESNDRDLVAAAHLQPNPAEIALQVEVQPSAGQHTIPLS